MVWCIVFFSTMPLDAMCGWQQKCRDWPASADVWRCNAVAAAVDVCCGCALTCVQADQGCSCLQWRLLQPGNLLCLCGWHVQPPPAGALAASQAIARRGPQWARRTCVTSRVVILTPAKHSMACFRACMAISLFIGLM